MRVKNRTHKNGSRYFFKTRLPAEMRQTLSPVFEEHVCYLVGDKMRELVVFTAEGDAACVENDFLAEENGDD